METKRKGSKEMGMVGRGSEEEKVGKDKFERAGVGGQRNGWGKGRGVGVGG